MKQLTTLLFIFLITTESFTQVFTSYNEGQAFTAIGVEKVSDKVWAGTDGEGVFHLENSKTSVTNFLDFPHKSDYDYTITDISVDDTKGHVYMSHYGTSATVFNGGVFRVNSATGTTLNYVNEKNYKGSKYDSNTVFATGKYGGLPGSRINSVDVDKNGTVWAVNNFHIFISGRTSVVTPGAIGFKKANFPYFKSYGGWYTNEGFLNAQPKELPYPAYTDEPLESQQSRSMRAVSSDKTSVWFGSFGYVPASDTKTFITPRVLEYDLEGNFISQHSIKEMGITGGVPNNILANDQKGTWVTGSFVDSGFSIKIGNDWFNTNNLDFKKIVPLGTRFNNNAVWKDEFGRVFIGTDNGLIVYDGFGDPLVQESYKIYTKNDIAGFSNGNELSITDPSMLSNNIKGGSNNGIAQWIATDNGIMKASLPADFGIHVYHVNDYTKYDKNTTDTDSNVTFLNTLTNFLITSRSEFIDAPEEDPNIGVATDNASATVLRLYVPNASDYYDEESKSKYLWYVGPGNEDASYSEREAFVTDANVKKDDEYRYKDQYGYFELKSLASYGQDIYKLGYVEFIYHHPKYIKEEDYVSGKKYSIENFTIISTDKDEDVAVEIFKNEIKIVVPPILMVHDVWSSVDDLKTIEKNFVTNGFEEFMLEKAWRPKSSFSDAENAFEVDSEIIPRYINKLKNKLVANSVSAGKVNIVAHGRGGLYARAYIEEIDTKIPFINDVNSLITVNTPHSGTQLANFVLDERTIPGSRLSADVFCEDLSQLSDGNCLFNAIAPGVPIGGLGRGYVVPAKDFVNQEGAKGMVVQDDNLSGLKPNDHYKLIEKLNSDKNLTKMGGVAFHVFSSEFEICKHLPDECEGITDFITGIFEDKVIESVGPKSLQATSRASKATLEIGNVITVVKGIGKKFVPGVIFAVWERGQTVIASFATQNYDGFNNSLFNGPNDLGVSVESMQMGLAPIFNTHIEGVPHYDEGFTKLFTNDGIGIIEHNGVSNGITELLTGNVYSTDLTRNRFSFDASFLKPTKLTYNLFPDLSIDDLSLGNIGSKNINSSNKVLNSLNVSTKTEATNEITSTVLINRDPEVFENVTEGDVLDFNVYGNNLDHIILVFESENEDDYASLVGLKDFDFENNVKFTLPRNLNFSGESKITAYGFNIEEGVIVSNYVTYNINTPTDIELESIRFNTSENPIVLNQSTFSFDVLGMYSDGTERKITNNENLTYVIEDATIISESDIEGFKAESEGESFLQASIDGLETSINVTVEENLSLLQTILTSFSGQLNDDELSVAVSWNTLREYENETFVLEASYGDADNFIEVNSQPGNGTSTTPAEFNYQDVEIAGRDTIFYRLKMIDVNQVETYSTTIEVLKAANATLSIDNFDVVENSFSLYPNPLSIGTEVVKLNVDTNFSDEKALIELYSLQGKKLALQSAPIISGKNEFDFKVSNKLSSGIYLVKLTTKSFVKTIRLVVE